MRINFLYRNPFESQFSIEIVFDSLIKCLPKKYNPQKIVLPNYCKGLIPRIRNILFATSNKATINHITGNIHYLALGLPRKNTVLTIHDLNIMYSRSIVRKLILWLFWVYLPVRRLKYITTVSEFSKKEIVRFSFCNPNKIKVIPNFIRPEFKNTRKDFNKNRPQILIVGTTPNKNIERQIKALAEITCSLIIIGQLNDTMIKLLIHERIEYKNYKNLSDNEMVDCYRKCDILLFCSLYEGFGLPIIEAQSIGRPVVTSEHAAMQEVAKNAAAFADPYSINSIRQAIKKVINKDSFREKLINDGYENVKRFEQNQIMKQYISMYDEIIQSL